MRCPHCQRRVSVDQLPRSFEDAYTAGIAEGRRLEREAVAKWLKKQYAGNLILETEAFKIATGQHIPLKERVDHVAGEKDKP